MSVVFVTRAELPEGVTPIAVDIADAIGAVEYTTDAEAMIKLVNDTDDETFASLLRDFVAQLDA